MLWRKSNNASNIANFAFRNGIEWYLDEFQEEL